MNGLKILGLIVVAAAVAYLAAFGIDHADESLMAGLIGTILLPLSVTVAVCLIVIPLTTKRGAGKNREVQNNEHQAGC